ncbi:MAG: hypothetical protein RML40_03335 [Bacteroidota bacterium]|nr:hypothetical protein [Bacteroidota bacterium]
MTQVEQSYKDVVAGFSLDLFQRVLPSYPRTTIKRFDGYNEGDEVHIEIHIPILNRTELWISRIIQQGEIHGHDIYADEWYFIDEGVELPSFLISWWHLHRIVQSESGSTFIIDEIEYRAPWYMQPFVHVVLSSQFAARQPIYREYFRQR